jgi:hypothetical protein
MTSAEPLLLVLIVLAILWIVGAQLNKTHPLPTRRPQPKAQGKEITPYLHVTGLQDFQCNELKAIVSHCDELALKKFIAYYRPGIVELDHYIQLLYKRFLDNLGKPPASASDIEKIAAANRVLLNDQPDPYDFTILTKADMRLLLEFGELKGHDVNEEFVQRFGDANFIENFNAYKQLLRNQERTLYVPKKDDQRPLLDLLASHGVVLKGRKIELQNRLRILPLSQLNDMARELKLRKTYQSHEHAVQSLAKAPGSAILLAMIYSIDDLFYLRPKAVDMDAVERELNVWTAYAKLIAWPAKQLAPNLAVNQSL